MTSGRRNDPPDEPHGWDAVDRLSRPGVDVTVVLPCFNEEGHVVAEVERICDSLDTSGYTYELLAVDDGSNDRTGAMLEEAARRRSAITVMRFRQNRGPGTARRVGTELAKGDIVVWTDADMTYPNERISELVAALVADPSCEQVVGLRTTEQGSYRFVRIPAKWLIRKTAEHLARATIPDLNSGLRAFRREVALSYLDMLPRGFSCVTTITLAFLAHQHRVNYLPVAYARRSGTSKFRVLPDTYRYLLQVVSVSMYFTPLRVLMPVALALLCLGAVKGGVDFVSSARVSVETVVIAMTGVVVASLALVADLSVRSRSGRENSGRRAALHTPDTQIVDHIAPPSNSRAR